MHKIVKCGIEFGRFGVFASFEGSYVYLFFIGNFLIGFLLCLFFTIFDHFLRNKHFISGKYNDCDQINLIFIVR